MGLEGIRKVRRDLETQKEQAVKDPLSDAPLELGVNAKSQEEIWQDPMEQARFVKYIGAKNMQKAKPIVDALTSNRVLTESQQTYLNEQVRGYNARCAEYGRLETVFSADYVRDMAETSKPIGLMVKQIGLERAHELLKRQFEMLAFENEKEYDKLVKAMVEERKVSQSDWASWVNRRVENELRRVGIPQDQIGKYVATSMQMPTGFDPAMQKEIEKEARRNMGIFVKLADSISRGSIRRGRAENLAHEFGKQRELMHRSDAQLSAIAKALNASVTTEMRLEMQRVMLEGGDLKTIPETNVNTIQEYKTVREHHSDTARKERFKAHMVAECKKLKKAPSAVTPAEKDSIKDSFVEKELKSQEVRKGGRFFAALLAILFRNKADLRSETDAIWT